MVADPAEVAEVLRLFRGAQSQPPKRRALCYSVAKLEASAGAESWMVADPEAGPA